MNSNVCNSFVFIYLSQLTFHAEFIGTFMISIQNFMSLIVHIVHQTKTYAVAILLLFILYKERKTYQSCVFFRQLPSCIILGPCNMFLCGIVVVQTLQVTCVHHVVTIDCRKLKSARVGWCSLA